MLFTKDTVSSDCRSTLHCTPSAAHANEDTRRAEGKGQALPASQQGITVRPPLRGCHAAKLWAAAAAAARRVARGAAGMAKAMVGKLCALQVAHPEHSKRLASTPKIGRAHV